MLSLILGGSLLFLLLSFLVWLTEHITPITAMLVVFVAGSFVGLLFLSFYLITKGLF